MLRTQTDHVVTDMLVPNVHVLILFVTKIKFLIWIDAATVLAYAKDLCLAWPLLASRSVLPKQTPATEISSLPVDDKSQGGTTSPL